MTVVYFGYVNLNSTALPLLDMSIAQLEPSHLCAGLNSPCQHTPPHCANKPACSPQATSDQGQAHKHRFQNDLQLEGAVHAREQACYTRSSSANTYPV
jgi:hypothetical protein